MNLVLRKVQLPLAHFTLEIDLALTARATAVFGPSGSGKTTLLELIAGIRRPSSGSIALDDTVLVDTANRARFVKPQHRAIGFLPQEGALFPHLTVDQNLRYGYAPEARLQNGLSFEHVTEVLEIQALTARGVGALSGGEQQRVALGRVLLSSPRLLLLDEPLAGLDTALKERLMPYLQRVRDVFNIPMIYVTHAADEVMALCDEVVVLESGRVTGHGPPGQFFEVSEQPRYRLRGAVKANRKTTD